MKHLVIYPGRFQPMLRHHVDVYDSLKRKFPDAEVIFGTSDKVEDGSPFNFKEKQAIAMAHGIDPSNIVEARSPYVHTFYKDSYNFDDYYVFFAVGEKDIKERFAMNNIDPDTGLDMKIKPNKETGEREAKYYQMINTYNKDNPKPMSERGYLFQVDNIEVEGEVASASAFRSALKNAPDKEAAKEVFKQQFSDYKENIFELVYNKIVGEKMSEDFNILMKLAGLEIKEGAPVEFESEVNVKDIEFTPPSKSSSFHSIANRFPDGSDVNDPDVKKEEFIQALLKSPANLLSEINERISPSDDNGLEASEKVNKIINQVEKEDGGIAKLNDDDKKFTLELVKKAIKEMELSAGDDTPAYDEEPEMPEESVNLSDIRSDYGVQEDEDDDFVYASEIVFFDKDGKEIGYMDWDGYDDANSNHSEQELQAIAQKFNISPQDGKVVGYYDASDDEVDFHDDGNDETYPEGTIGVYIDTHSKETMGKEESIEEGGDCYHCDGKDDDCEHCDGDGYVKFDDDPNEPSQEEIDAHYTIVKKYIGKRKKDESVEEEELNDIRKRAGLEEKEEESLEDKLKGIIGMYQARIDDYEDDVREFEKDYGKSDEAKDEDVFMDYTSDIIVNDEEDKRDAFKQALSDHQQDGTTHWSQADIGGGLDTAVRDEIGMYLQEIGASEGDLEEEAVEESSEDSGEGPIDSMSDEELMDYVGQREEDIVDDIQQHIAPDFLHKENYEEMFELYREEVLIPAAEEISQDKAMDQMPDEMEMDAEESIDVDEAGCTPAHRKINKKKKEAVEDTSSKALEAAMSELKKLAGLNEEDKKEFDEAGCMAEMKKLYASGCTKESMYSKLNAEYNCNRKQFEELYAGSCG